MSLGNEFETDSKQKAQKSKSIVKIVIIAGAVIVVLCAVVLGLYFMKNADYNSAVEMLDDSKPQEAAEIFNKLRDFKESKEYILKCNYLMATNVFDDGEYEEAAGMFEALGDYEDSAEKLAESKNYIKYNEAKKLMEEGDYAEAQVLFLELENFKDSSHMAEECRKADEYEQAVALMESDDFEGAQKMFEGIFEYRECNVLALVCSYKVSYLDAVQKAQDEEFVKAWNLLRDIKLDAKENEIELSLVADEEEYSELMSECRKYVYYDKASKHFDNEKYYYAYINYMEAGVLDSEEKAQQCIQEFPSGEIYSNPDYPENEATIIFRSDSARTENTILKVYDGKTLVSMVAIKPGQRVTIKIPEGIYSIAGGSGEMWFGEKNYFGGEGSYGKLHFSEEHSVEGMRHLGVFFSFFKSTIDIYAEDKGGNMDIVSMTYRQFLDLD